MMRYLRLFAGVAMSILCIHFDNHIINLAAMSYVGWVIGDEFLPLGESCEQ